MKAKLLLSEETLTDYRFSVLIDDTKMIPDPAYVREYQFGKQPPEGVKEADYLTSIQDELKSYVEHEQNKLAGNTPLKGFKL